MIILGSSSPRRIKMIEELNVPFKIIKPIFDEKSIPSSSNHLAMLESYNKAISIKNLAEPQDCIITCDTIVTYKDKVFGKPIDKNDAFNTLKFLSNKTHKVITGYTIIYKENIIKKEVETEVTFNNLSDDFIWNYINGVNVMDKAGSYAIQDNEKFPIIKGIKGSLNNVIGFPIEEIKKDLVLLHII